MHVPRLLLKVTFVTHNLYDLISLDIIELICEQSWN